MADWRSLEIDGPSGRIANTFIVHGRQRVAVVLPGFMGGWTTPATYYPVLALLDAHFDALCLDSIYREHPDVDVLKGDAAAAIAAANAEGAYRDVLLMAKSLGTIAVAELIHDGAVPTTARTIWITPLLRNDRVANALDALQTPALVLIGTQDPAFDQAHLHALAGHDHEVVVLEGANHGLMVEGEAAASARIPGRLVAAVYSYASSS